MNRVIYSDNGTLSDISNDIKAYRSGSKAITMKTTDAIYIGQRAPFNHLFFKLSTLNTTVAELSAKIWNGTTFVGVAELNDETDNSGKPFGQSGFMTWTPDRDEAGWASEDTDDITELNSLKIYDRYWLKLTTDTLLTEFDVHWIGQKFADDDDLYGEFPLFSRSNMKIAFESGKTDWEEQQIAASKIIVQDLIKSGIIDDGAQILERGEFSLAQNQKVAELIFNGFGDDYEDDRLKAKNEYKSRINKRLYKVDVNKDADLSLTETKRRAGFLNR